MPSAPVPHEFRRSADRPRRPADAVDLPGLSGGHVAGHRADRAGGDRRASRFHARRPDRHGTAAQKRECGARAVRLHGRVCRLYRHDRGRQRGSLDDDHQRSRLSAGVPARTQGPGRSDPARDPPADDPPARHRRAAVLRLPRLSRLRQHGEPCRSRDPGLCRHGAIRAGPRARHDHAERQQGGYGLRLAGRFCLLVGAAHPPARHGAGAGLPHPSRSAGLGRVGEPRRQHSGLLGRFGAGTRNAGRCRAGGGLRRHGCAGSAARLHHRQAYRRRPPAARPVCRPEAGERDARRRLSRQRSGRSADPRHGRAHDCGRGRHPFGTHAHVELGARGSGAARAGRRHVRRDQPPALLQRRPAAACHREHRPGRGARRSRYEPRRLEQPLPGHVLAAGRNGQRGHAYRRPHPLQSRTGRRARGGNRAAGRPQARAYARRSHAPPRARTA